MRGIIIHICFGFAILLTCFGGCGRAFALKGDIQEVDGASLQLIAASDAAGTDKTLDAGLMLHLDPDWHSYWRMPGEGGLAPTFDWSGSQNVDSVTVLWPRPERFQTADFYSFGYSGDVIFPLDVHLKQAGQAATLMLKADIMVCKTICVPQHFKASLAIPAGNAVRSDDAPSITQARALVPHAGDTGSLKIKTAVVGPKGLVVDTWSAQGYDHADLLAEVKGGSFFFTAPPVITLEQKDPRNATMVLAPPDNAGDLAKALMHHTVTLTLIGGGQAIEKNIDF